MRTALIAAIALSASVGTANAELPGQPKAPAPSPVTETLYGQTVVDPFRYMEKLGPETTDWMKAEGAFTHAFFASMPGRAALGRALSAYTADDAPVSGVEAYGGRLFYEERAPGSDNKDLMVRQPDGTVVKLVDVGALRAAKGGEPYAINYFQPSPDGKKVAVGISAGGSEDAVLTVVDAQSGKTIAGPVERARFGIVFWTSDSGALFTNQLQVTDNRMAKYSNSKAVFWDLKSDPTPVVGVGVPGPIKPEPSQFPAVGLAPGSRWAFAAVINGVQNEKEAWIAPAAKAQAPDTPWVKFLDRKDDVTNFTLRGDKLFLLSHKDAPTFKVLSLQAGRPLAEAKTVLPAKPGRLVEAVEAASDALYVKVREGLYSHLLRINDATGAVEDLPLPVKGSIDEIFTDPRKPGVIFSLEGWTTPKTFLRYDAKAKTLADLHLGKAPNLDASAYQETDLTAEAKDGTKVPLSYVEPKGFGHPGIVLVDAYGSYGISEFAYFSLNMTFLLQQNVAVATCHVRGGGELGEAWRLAGKDANKPNTWRDLIACGDALVAKGYATNKSLFIIGGSAGGITMGRAMEERPDLFAGVLDMVPAANTVRAQFSPNGPPNIPEFGSIKNEQGFKNLYAMDSYLGVETGKAYPPIMITTGLNDPRVDPWEPAKLAARLLSSGDPNPVLLRVDAQAGHGIGSTKSQGDELFADAMSFIFWRAGRAEFQPKL